ncbi:MAG: type II secretion system minor pseudopilin GspJ [Silvania sp.]|uniref:type II secretion system minor pseudopilin GspJ n=1 Tax=Silvania sp. TaxID=3016633 RepID=UPI003EE6FE39
MKSVQRGFTLLEVLVALVIFALLSLAAQAVFQGVLRNNSVMKAKIARLSELSFAMQQLENDFIHMAPRTVRESGEAKNTLFVGADGVLASREDGVTFTRSGWINPDARLRRSEFQRLGWRLKGTGLERLSWLYPDSLPGAQPRQRVILTAVRQFRLRYYRDGRWSSRWATPGQIPQAVEVTLALSDYGTVTRRFWLAEEGR